MTSTTKRLKVLASDGGFLVLIGVLAVLDAVILDSFLLDPRQVKPHFLPVKLALWLLRWKLRLFGLITRNKERRLCCDAIKAVWGSDLSNLSQPWTNITKTSSRQLEVG